MSNNSDYKKPRTNLFERLPNVLRSDANKSLMENLFNRFLSKQETRKVAGYIGEGNPNAVVKRQIQEFNVHRQGYQLQPILYNKIGSVEWMSSWYDLLNEAERLGIDRERMQDWLNLLKFNWAPPIDIDKLIHYRDYYWYDADNPNSSPQYITIRSRCSTAKSLVNFYQNLVDEFGATIPTHRAVSVDETIPEFAIVQINDPLNTIIVQGNATADLTFGQYFAVNGTFYNNAVYQVNGALLYDDINNITTIPIVSLPTPVVENNVGTVTPQRFDKLVILGEYARLFDAGFTFFYKSSTNIELNQSFWKVVESSYDESTNETTIKINTTFTNSVVDGVISLEEKLTLALADRDCQCEGSVGWDILQWDDNPSNPLWDGDHAPLLSTIASPTEPVGPVEGQLWYNTSVDELRQYSLSTGWKSIWGNFSTIVEDTEGFALWDYTEGCGVSSVITAADQWINENRWLHKSDVPNFSIAKQAQVPIIEYEWDLEINEWTYTPHIWKYREDNYSSWQETDANPELVELVPVVYYNLGGTDTLRLDERYGDLTDYFTPGTKFMIQGIGHIFEVKHSVYSAGIIGRPAKTRVTVTEDITTLGLDIDWGQPAAGVDEAEATKILSSGVDAPLRPLRTSLGHSWKGFNIHWVYVGAGDTVPVPHQPSNNLISIEDAQEVYGPVTHGSGEYEYTATYYTQEAKVLVETGVTDVELADLTIVNLPASSRNLRQRALVGTNDIRVYVNDVRQYGNYDELTECDLGGSPCDANFVAGIRFLPGFELDRFDIVRIEVGEATPKDFGFTSIPVRTVEDNAEYGPVGNQYVSLVKYRKEEQVKTDTNQYPLFDMYRVDGSPAYQATSLFAFKTTSDADINFNVGLRLETDVDSLDYIFQQFLVEDDGTMYAYRDYANRVDNIWIDSEEQRVFFWDGLAWSEKTTMGNLYYSPVIVSDVVPLDHPMGTIVGAYWYDTLSDELKQYTGTTWDVVTAKYSLEDPALQTIWKKGLNDETYIPEKRDWEKRSLEEYNEEKTVFVAELADEYILSGMTELEAIAQATTEWNTKQSNHLSPTGAWIGDWEVPDPLYFNVSHENRDVVSYRELLTHFNTIIQEQPKIPGFNGPRENMFHLIPSNEVNFGLGGKIHEFNNGFDTFLSSLFINSVSPRALFEFAHDQYEALLNNLKELYRKEAVDLLIDTTTESLIDISNFIVDAVVQAHEQNDNFALLYGDSSTFTEVDGTNDIGIRNWIATLPYIKALHKLQPTIVVDPTRGVNEVVHHDGHRHDYILVPAVIEGIVRSVVGAPDPRTKFPGPTDPAIDTFGRISTDLPPNDVAEFESIFTTPILDRSGVYWYTVNGTDRKLYRLTLAAIGEDEPSSTLPDGTLWLDLTTGLEVLRVKTTDPNTGINDWEPVPGLSPGTSPIRFHNGTDPTDLNTSTISAWQEINLNEILLDVVLEVEQRLFDNAPVPFELAYDFNALEEQFPVLYQQKLEEAFLAFVNQSEIEAPYANDEYTSADPFTWNYRYSIPGQGYQIVFVDTTANSFHIEGNVTTGFGLGTIFYVKNSGANDGFWKTHPTVAAAYNAIDDITVIYLFNDRAAVGGALGTLYKGTLPSPYDPTNYPSNLNDGSASGGDWRDLYEKLYHTPYPHLEPWKLQGYVDKPMWWDEEYLNDDPLKWGDRRWKYKHGFEIVNADPPDDFFEIEGDFRELFVKGKNFRIDRASGYHPSGPWVVGSFETIAAVNVGTAGTATIELTAPTDHVAAFPPGYKFAVASLTGDLKGLFTVVSATFTGPALNRTILVVEEAITDGTGFDVISGTTYNPATNRSRIYIDTTALVGDITVDHDAGRIIPLDPTGIVEQGYGMWENIRLGVIPENQEYPNGVVGITGIPEQDRSFYFLTVDDLPTFKHLSVNIGNDTITIGGTFRPDDVFPPYWNVSAYWLAEIGTPTPAQFDIPIRSVFTLLTEIVSPGTSYAFGDAGPIEWTWRSSSQFLYDQLAIAFQLDPIRLMFRTFGPEFYTVGGLFINKRTEQVLSHTNTVFHGDVVGSTLMDIGGTNQWYVNFGRYIGLDISMSDFRSTWTQWTAPLMYQFSSFIDTPSFELAHRYICVSEFDYRVTSKRSLGVEDYWIDSFEVVFLNIPPVVARYDNDLDWEVELKTRSPVGNSVKYYDIRNYQFYADPTTDICTLYTWNVTNVDVLNNRFSIRGDHTTIFATGRELDVVDSTSNDGTYVTISSTYNQITNETIIEVEEDILGIVADGLLVANYRTLPWTTGDRVTLTTTETLPVPLEGDNVNGVYEYFVIVLGSNTFKLARTKEQALSGANVDITTVGRGNQYIGQIATTFNTTKTNKNWRHYVVDRSTVLEFTPPYDLRGLQTVVNIIDGYDAYTKDQGWRINADNSLKDFNQPSRMVSWQLELERLIDYGIQLRDARRRLTDRFETVVDLTTDVWTFQGEGRPQFITGDPISVIPTGQVYPVPLQRGQRYYMIRDSISQFRIAATRADAQQGVAIDITDLSGVGQLSITAASNLRKDRPSFEIDPFRDGIWFRPERGIVSNVIQGPAEDVFNTQLLLDQYSRPIGQNNIRVYREDKQTSLRLKESIPNDVELTSVFNDPYNYIHLASAHLFLDTYEHVLIFNSETTEGQTLYDPFIGLNVTKFETLFNRQIEFTQRPNVGGQFLITTNNQGAELRRNIEASIEDLRLLYDTYQVIESNDLVTKGRKSLGYEGRQDYLDNLNLSAKSQFAFWKGQIQAKGSINSVKAFINSRRFIDAKVDEYWAVKVADFGSANEKEYLSMWLTTTDALSTDLRLQFISDDDLCTPGYDTNPYDNSLCGYANPETGEAVFIGEPGFIPVSMTDPDRWYDQPDQLELLRNNGGVMYFDMKVHNRMDVAVAASAPPSPELNDGWIDTSTNTFKRWNGTTWSDHGSWTGSPVGLPLLRHDMQADFITITMNWYPEGYVWSPAGSPPASGTLLVVPKYVPFTNSISVFKDGIELVGGEDYIEALDSGEIMSTKIQFAEDITGSVIEVVYKPTTLLNEAHFERITSNILQLKITEILTDVTEFTIWGWNVDVDSQNPAKIIDKKSEVVITPLQVWDPARGHHYYNGIHVVDLQRDTDPAIYSNTPIVNQFDFATTDPYIVINNPWNQQEVGRTWMDTTNLDYLPYYDIAVINDIEDRSRLWGSLAGWGEIKIRTWVESDVPPEEWNALAEQEEGNAAISESERKAGRVYQTLFEKDGINWVVAKPKFDEFDVLIEGTGAGTNTFQLNNTLKYGTGSPLEYLPVDVYVNGSLKAGGVIPSPTGQVIVADLRDVDRVRVILPVPTDEDYITSEIEAGNLLREYQYTTDTYFDNLGYERTLYYFWVEDKTTKSDRTISPQEAQAGMREIPIPYVFFQGPKDRVNTTFGDVPVTLPVRFSQAIVRGLRGIIDDDFRYVIRWTRDFTLRDRLDTGATPLQNKNLHQEWQLIRREQPNHIPHWLWNRVTEAILGYTLDDSTVRVPSYERELYDAQNNASTRIGLGDDQAIADGQLALATILADLNNPNNDFAPVDINVFFQNHSFDTPDEIRSSMATIYNTFPYIHVNRMFFDVLLDGLSQQDKYANIFKTSMIALHGIRPFQVAGVFDD